MKDWRTVEHHNRCNIEVIGAEPLIEGGDCTCGAIADDDGLCERCGSYTNSLAEATLMARGRPIASWMLCLACRNALRIEDLLELVGRRLNDLQS